MSSVPVGSSRSSRIRVVCRPSLRVYSSRLACSGPPWDDGSRQPCYDLWRRNGAGFGTRVLQGVSRGELLDAVAELG